MKNSMKAAVLGMNPKQFRPQRTHLRLNTLEIEKNTYVQGKQI